MKKSELRKLIRETIKEQFWGGGNTMTADCSQFTFPGPQDQSGNTIASPEWCSGIVSTIENNPTTNTQDWCNGQEVNNAGFLNWIDTVNDLNQCGICYCIEQTNTGTKPSATDSFGNPVSPVGSGPGCRCCPEVLTLVDCVTPSQCPPDGQAYVVTGGYCYPNPDNPNAEFNFQGNTLTYDVLADGGIATDCNESWAIAPEQEITANPYGLLSWGGSMSGGNAVYLAHEACPGGESEYLAIYDWYPGAQAGAMGAGKVGLPKNFGGGSSRKIRLKESKTISRFKTLANIKKK